MEQTKRCIKCAAVKPIDQFYRSESRTYKPYRVCNSCERVRQKSTAKLTGGALMQRSDLLGRIATIVHQGRDATQFWTSDGIASRLLRFLECNNILTLRNQPLKYYEPEVLTYVKARHQINFTKINGGAEVIYGYVKGAPKSIVVIPEGHVFHRVSCPEVAVAISSIEDSITVLMDDSFFKDNFDEVLGYD